MRHGSHLSTRAQEPGAEENQNKGVRPDGVLVGLNQTRKNTYRVGRAGPHASVLKTAPLANTFSAALAKSADMTWQGDQLSRRKAELGYCRPLSTNVSPLNSLQEGQLSGTKPECLLPGVELTVRSHP